MLCMRRDVVTIFVFVCLFDTVHVQMFPQNACIRGCIIALVAFVWLFSTVHFQMSTSYRSPIVPLTNFCHPWSLNASCHFGFSTVHNPTEVGDVFGNQFWRKYILVGCLELFFNALSFQGVTDVEVFYSCDCSSQMVSGRQISKLQKWKTQQQRNQPDVVPPPFLLLLLPSGASRVTWGWDSASSLNWPSATWCARGCMGCMRDGGAQLRKPPTRPLAGQSHMHDVSFSDSIQPLRKFRAGFSQKFSRLLRSLWQLVIGWSVSLCRRNLKKEGRGWLNI